MNSRLSGSRVTAGGQTDGQTDRQTDMTKLIATLRNFANASKDQMKQQDRFRKALTTTMLKEMNNKASHIQKSNISLNFSKIL